MKYIDSLGLCKCRATDKDYDPDRGFYFDKYDWPFLRYRFACRYECTANGESTQVEGYVHEEKRWQLFGQKGGPDIARFFNCRRSISRFIPRCSSDDYLKNDPIYYEPVPLGDFDPRGSGIEGLEKWAEENCADCKE